MCYNKDTNIYMLLLIKFHNLYYGLLLVFCFLLVLTNI